jgi:hypothetical protein
MRIKMAEAVDLAALHDAISVDRAMARPATAGRFGHSDLAAIRTHSLTSTDLSSTDTSSDGARAQRTGGHNSLAQGTASSAGLGADHSEQG